MLVEARHPQEHDTSRLSVCLSFDFDGPSGWVADSLNPAVVSRGEFGAVAVPRVLDLLDRHRVKATFFVPGHSALAYPRQVTEILERGHEIGHHGWVHESTADFPADAQREFLDRGLDALARVTGVRPIGYRAPSASYSPASVELLLEAGMLYDSGFSGSDFQPYYLRQGDRWSATEAYQFGTVVDLVELPFSWHLDDWVHFEFLEGYATSLKSPNQVSETWLAEFDYGYRHEPGGVLVLCMHPDVIGRASRLSMLDQLITAMASHPGIVFERMDDYARRWRAAHPLEEWVTSASPLVPRPFTPTTAQESR